MKKLLITGLCILGLYSIPNARASNIAALPLDNTHTTHHVLVPELPQSVSGSYQVAKVQWLPDYQKNMTGKNSSRTNDGGAGPKGEKTCGQYGLIGSCPAPQIEDGKTIPIPGLVCYKQCICPATVYKYNANNCISPAELGTEVCSGLYKLTMSVSSNFTSMVTRYTDSIGTRNQPTNSNSSSNIETLMWMSQYKNCSCPSEYKYDTLLTNAICQSCTVGNTSKYKCECKDGFLFKNGKCEPDCDGYDLTECPSHGVCSQCPNDGNLYKFEGCEKCYSTTDPFSSIKYPGSSSTQSTPQCWSIALGGRGVPDECKIQIDVTCAEGYTTPKPTCGSKEKVVIDMSGGIMCYKCVAKDDNCQSGYSKTPCVSSEKEKSRAETEAGSICYNCVPKDDTCPTGYNKTACASGYKQTDTKTTELGTLCYLCKKDTCPTGYSKACASGYKQTATTQTDAGTTCYQCKNDICPTGYTKKCDSEYKQTDTKTTEAGTTCYKCVLKTCEDYNSSYKSSEPSGKKCTSFTQNGLTCYKDCQNKTCKDYGYLDADPQDGRTCTKFTVENLTCYTDCTYKNSGGSGGGACDEDEITLRNVCVHRCPGGEPIDGNVAPDWCHNCCGYSATTWKNPRWTGKCCTNNTTNYQKPGNNLTDVGAIY